MVINKGGLSCTPVHYCTCTCFVVAYFLFMSCVNWVICRIAWCRTRDRCNGEWPRVVAWNAECTSPRGPRCLCHTTQHILGTSAAQCECPPSLGCQNVLDNPPATFNINILNSRLGQISLSHNCLPPSCYPAAQPSLPVSLPSTTLLCILNGECVTEFRFAHCCGTTTICVD